MYPALGASARSPAPLRYAGQVDSTHYVSPAPQTPGALGSTLFFDGLPYLWYP
jgi:hypothetical protein